MSIKRLTKKRTLLRLPTDEHSTKKRTLLRLPTDEYTMKALFEVARKIHAQN